jgi:spore coat polysaccharide biosynthesis protein SpsF
MRTVIIVQARMTSTRLPGKVLKEVLGKPLLEYQIERLRRVRLADQIVIATTTNATDLPIVELCDRLGTAYFRGAEEDVLGRYHDAATRYGADVVVRVTSDCPIIDPAVVDHVIKFYLDHRAEYDYVSNGLKRTYPRGMDAEVFPYRVLHEAYLEAVEKPDREHVTPFIYRHPQRYRLANVCFSEDQGHQRWTVDTREDFELIRRIIEALYPVNREFALRDVLNLLAEHPDWAAINAHVEQKKLGQ